MLKLEIFVAEGVFFIPDGVWRYAEWVKKHLMAKKLPCKNLKLEIFVAEGVFFIPDGVWRYAEWVKKRLMAKKLNFKSPSFWQGRDN